ncbi:protein NinF [Klebsiella michiganensis]|uniref:protein NinF n=1 Tax=Klebsiella michiganensis TaxID=1134687 RepID=UPI003CFDEB7D
MLSPEQIQQYQSESNCRAGYCMQCKEKLTPVEVHVCDACAISLYADPNGFMTEEDDGSQEG